MYNPSAARVRDVQEMTYPHRLALHILITFEDVCGVFVKGEGVALNQGLHVPCEMIIVAKHIRGADDDSIRKLIQYCLFTLDLGVD